MELWHMIYYLNFLLLANCYVINEYKNIFKPLLLEISFSNYFSNNIISGCRQKCSISNKNLNQCWNPTLAFYEQTLLGLMRQYVFIQVFF